MRGLQGSSKVQNAIKKICTGMNFLVTKDNVSCQNKIKTNFDISFVKKIIKKKLSNRSYLFKKNFFLIIFKKNLTINTCTLNDEYSSQNIYTKYIQIL